MIFLFDLFAYTVGEFQSFFLLPHILISSLARPKNNHHDTQKSRSFSYDLLYKEISKLINYSSVHRLCRSQGRISHMDLHSLMIQPNQCASGTYPDHHTIYPVFPGVGSPSQVGFSDWPFFRSIWWRIYPTNTLIMITYNHHLHPLITRVQAVDGIVYQHLLWKLLIELLEDHGFFHLTFIQLNLITL